MAGTQVVFNDRALRKLLAESGDVGKAMTRLALRVERRAKAIAPVRTGRLRASIQSSVDVAGPRVVAIIGTTVEYAAYVEYGTRHMAAQPYLRPALQYVSQQAGGIL